MSYLVYGATVWGAGLTPDSISYLDGARTILKENSLQGLGTHFPPLYFVLIAVVGAVTGDPLSSLRYIQIGLIALNTSISLLIVWNGTKRKLAPTLTLAILLLTSPPFLHIHVMAWSEATFCLFALLGIYFLAEYFRNRRKSIPVVTIAAVFFSLAFLTRYVGITLIITGMLAIFLSHGSRDWKRLSTVTYFGFISSLPMIVWMLRNWLTSDQATSRAFIYHPVSLTKIKTGIKVMLNWFYIPESSPVLLLIFLIIIFVMYGLSYRKNEANNDKTIEMIFIFIAIYILFIITSISFFDAHTPLSRRILFPVYLFFVLSVFLIIERFANIEMMKKAGYFLYPLLILFSFYQIYFQKEFFLNVQNHGIGYANKTWASSNTIEWIESLPENIIIYSNGPDAIKLFTGRNSKMIPNIVNPSNRTKNKNLVNDIKAMHGELLNHQGVLIYFHSITWRWYLPSLNQLSRGLPLQYVYKGKDGVGMQIGKTQSENQSHN